MATTTQIRERIIILLSLAAFSLTFLCYRDSDSIPTLYVGVNSVRINIVLAAVYCAGD